MMSALPPKAGIKDANGTSAKDIQNSHDPRVILAAIGQ